MSDFWFALLVIGGVAVFFAAWCVWEHYVPRVLERLFRKAAGADDSSTWQPSARPIAGLTFALLLLLPLISRVAVGWPHSAFGLFYTAYVTALMAGVLTLSAASARFQRFVFSQQPVPADIARRFTFGIVFFLCLFVASAYGYIHYT